ncbi:glycosyltransferase [Bacillus inaquosorum]|nr:glycosyltransferase [Bacillus inaquosorum]
MEDKNYKLSVVVLVYNTENYLRECLDSLINQTLKDIQIIIVNDESPDNSLEIIKEYQRTIVILC